MPPKPIVQEVRVTGTPESIQQLREMGFQVEQVGDATQQTGEQARGAGRDVGEFGGFVQGAARHAISLAGSLLGGAGVVAALQFTRQEAEASADALERFVNALAATQALTRDPQFQKAAAEAAVESGRSIEEIGGATFLLTSGLEGRTSEFQRKVLLESAELSKTEPDVPFDQFVNLMVTLSNVSKDLNPQQVQNLGVSIEDLAKVDIRQLSQTISGPLGVAGPANVSIPEAAALFAKITQTREAPIAATATENIINRLAVLSDQGRKVFGQRGIDITDDAFTNLRALAESNQQQEVTAAEFRSLLGEGPAASALPLVLDQIDDVIRRAGTIESAIAPGAPDLGAAKVRDLENQLRGFPEVTRKRQAEQRLEQEQRDSGLATEELQAAAIRAELDRRLIEAGEPPVVRFAAEKRFNISRFLGRDPISSLEFAVPTGSGELAPGSLDIVGARRRLIAEILREVVPEANTSADDFGPQGVIANSIGPQNPVVVNNRVVNIGTNFSPGDPLATSPEIPDLNQ